MQDFFEQLPRHAVNAAFGLFFAIGAAHIINFMSSGRKFTNFAGAQDQQQNKQ